MEEESLPIDSDTRGLLVLGVDNLIVSETKHQSLCATFVDDDSLSESETLYEEGLSRVPSFLFTVVKEQLVVPGLREDLTFVFSVCRWE